LVIAGPDRVGITTRVGAFLKDRRANIRTSYGVVKEGRFCCRFLFDSTEEDLAAIVLAAPAALSGLNPTIEPLPGKKVGKQLAELSLLCLDHEGILHEIGHAMEQLNVGIEELSSARLRTPQTGLPIFCLNLTLCLPKHLPVQAIRSALREVLAPRRHWDIDIRLLSEERRDETSLLDNLFSHVVPRLDDEGDASSIH